MITNFDKHYTPLLCEKQSKNRGKEEIVEKNFFPTEKPLIVLTSFQKIIIIISGVL
jgi:hypothetical protein